MSQRDKRALIAQAAERFKRSQTARNFFFNKKSQDFAARRQDFFSNDNEIRVPLFQNQRAFDCVMIRDDQFS